MNEQNVKIFLSQEEFEDFDDLKNEDIEQNEAQSPWKTGVHQCPIEDKEPRRLEPRTPEPQLRRSERVRKPNLRYINAVVVEE